MMEFLFTCAQVACLAGYLCGACIAVGERGESLARELARRKRSDPARDIEDSVYLRRYKALDA